MNCRLKVLISAVTCLLVLGAQSFVPKAAAEVKSACSLVTAEDVEAFIGEPASRPQRESYYSSSTCRFLGSQNRTKYLSVMVQQVTTDSSAGTTATPDYFKIFNFKNVQQVLGVGDEAMWASATFGGRQICQLFVNKGKSTRLIIMIGGFPDDADTLDRARILANKILSKLDG